MRGRDKDPNVSVDQNNGTVTFPPNAFQRPKQGGSTRLHNGADFMFMTVKDDNPDAAYIELLIGEDSYCESPKLYHLNMNFRADQEPQGDAIVTARPYTLDPEIKPDDIIFQTKFAIPSTNSEWVDMAEPLALDGKLGGLNPHKVLLRIQFPKPQGRLQIRHFQLIPHNASSTDEYSIMWFQTWCDELKSKLIGGCLPSLELHDTETLKAESQKIQDLVTIEGNSRGHPQLNANQKATAAASQECIRAVSPMLEGLDEKLRTLNLDDNLELLQFIAITCATPLRLADYCAQGQVQTARLMNLLKKDQALLKDFLMYGGPKWNQYGRALDIYAEIQEKRQQGKAVLPRLALAVALEMAYPICEIETDDVPIGPIERYLHYEKAYLEGELDPYFESHSVWNLRMAVASPASNEELEWAREMIKVYRPDFYAERKYNFVGGSDFLYVKPPDRIAGDRMRYHHILSFGGRCGAAALFSRLMMQSFGVPTWGLVVPGHATYDHWTTQGFTRKYDGGRWEGRRAFDFYHEEVIRKVLGHEEYLKRLVILDVMSILAGESPKDSHPDPELPWHSLASLQRRRLGSVRESREGLLEDLEVESKVLVFASRKEPETEEIGVEDNGTITIPSFARTSEQKGVTWMKCFSGGMQMNVRDDGWLVEYIIPADKLPDEPSTYKLVFTVATVHDQDLAPINFLANAVEYKSPIPYTEGLWKETEAIEVKLGGTEDAVIKLSRTMPYHPMAVKEFKLVAQP